MNQRNKTQVSGKGNEKLKRQRKESLAIGKTIYEITAEEKDGVKATPLIILQELIDRHFCEAIYSPDCCLEFDGGNADVKYANGIE